MKEALIIGTGLGGLATALRLASRGYRVTMLEKASSAGGRLNQFKKEGFSFDTGPSFFSMGYEFDKLFEDCGMKNPLPLEPLDPVYSVYFPHHSQPFRIYKDLDKLAAEFDRVEPGFRHKMRQYLDDAGRLFHDTEQKILKRNYNSTWDFLSAMSRVPLKYLPLLQRSMWKELSRYFDSDEARTIFSLVAFFLGATPFNTPAIYKLLNYTELKHDGYWNVKGGMYRIVEIMVEKLEALGVTIHYNTEVKAIETQNDQIEGFTDQYGRFWRADVYITNADAASFRGQILKREKYKQEKLDKMHWTLAPFTMYLGIRGKLSGLDHHNYFLGSNFQEYASGIFESPSAPEQPYYYVNVSSRSNPETAPEGCENVFVLCPVPDLRYKPDWSDADRLRDTIIKDLSERTGNNIEEKLITETVWTPADWESSFNLYRGSGLGLAHDLNQIGAWRPSNKDEEFSNLYYTGASTVPGTGLPIVVISSGLVTERILKEHGSFYENHVRV